MIKNIFLGYVLITLLLTSCGDITNVESSHPSYENVPPSSANIEKSLFNSKDKTISEEDIQRLLSGKITIGNSIRIAVFNYSAFSQRSSYSGYYYYSADEEFLKTQQSFIETLTKKLEKSEKTEKVILMPSIMANKESSITNLRETAVRLQADLLLVYNIKSDIYYKYKAFSADEAKAFATIECFLMDTRTGVIPFSTINTKESLQKKTSNEFTIDVQRKNAEKEAVIKALNEIGSDILEFLQNN